MSDIVAVSADPTGAEEKTGRIKLTADIVAAYVTKNSLPLSDLPPFIASIFAGLGTIGESPKPVEEPRKEPAVPIKKSITHDYIVCLEDGKKFKTLKRHLFTAYNMAPEQYRAKWGLPVDYPMTAPSYSEKRSGFAKAAGLGAPRKAAAEKASKPRAKKAA